VQTESQLWGLLLDFQFTPVGGCQQEVQIGQSVLWAFDASSKAYFLDLQTTAEAIMRVGEHASFVVTDGATGAAIAGAVVSAVRGGPETATSAADGSVTVTFATRGMKTFKAERSDSIRSNEVTILVLLSLDGLCRHFATRRPAPPISRSLPHLSMAKLYHRVLKILNY
jgi:hypothetical protein